MEYKIDANIIDKAFNLKLDPNGVIFPTNDNAVVPYLHYEGLLSFDYRKERNMFCYNVNNGQNMFSRWKYAYYNHKENLYLSRNGDAIKNLEPSRPALTPEEHQELMKADSPPVDELKSLFDCILSVNQKFFIFFSYQHVEHNVINHRYHLEEILKGKPINEYKSEYAQKSLIKLFTDNQLINGGCEVLKPCEINQVISVKK